VVTVEPERLEDVVLVRVLRLNAVAQGVAVGVVVGLALFGATNWLVLRGGPVVGPHLGLLAQIFPGYRVSFLGSFVGFGYGFASGFGAGYFVSMVYNWLVVRRRGSG
jgi:hypothetical protein